MGQSNAREFSPLARAEAIRALGKINPQSPKAMLAIVEAIRQQDSGPMPKVEESALAILSALGPESAQVIPRFIENLEFQNKRVDRGVSAVYPVGALAPGYAETVPPLIRALKDPSSQTKAAAAYDLGTLQPADLHAAKKALPDLIKLLNDNVAEVKLRAAEAILKIDLEHGQITVPALIELTEDPDYTIRLRAMDGLRRLGPAARSAVPSLKKRLVDDEVQVVRVWSAKVLKDIEENPSAGVSKE